MSEELAQDRELAPRIAHFQQRTNLLFSYFFCVHEFEGDQDLGGDPASNDRTWALQTIQNACLHTTLTALRDLDDFFTPRTPTTNPDDIRASDFGPVRSLSFLSQTERTGINKQIAHTTTTGATARKYRWDLQELTTKAVAQCLTFLEWLEANHSHHFLVLTAAATCRAKITTIHNWLTATHSTPPPPAAHT